MPSCGHRALHQLHAAARPHHLGRDGQRRDRHRAEDLERGAAQPARIEPSGPVELTAQQRARRPGVLAALGPTDPGSARWRGSRPRRGRRTRWDRSARLDPMDRLPDWRTVAKQRQMKMQMQAGALQAIPLLESRTDEQLRSESKHRVAAKALLGARAAEKYDAKAARAYFNEALAGCHPQERPALRQMMQASMALAERRPDDLKAAVEKLGQEAPSSRQLFLLRIMGLIAPPPGAGVLTRVRGIAILVAAVVVLLALGFGLAKLADAAVRRCGHAADGADRPAHRGRRARRPGAVRAQAPGQGRRRALGLARPRPSPCGSRPAPAACRRHRWRDRRAGRSARPHACPSTPAPAWRTRAPGRRPRPVTTKNWLPAVPGGSAPVLAIATTPRSYTVSDGGLSVVV